LQVETFLQASHLSFKIAFPNSLEKSESFLWILDNAIPRQTVEKAV
jgi:hypothetical protein